MSKKVVQIIAKTGLAINNSLQNEEMQPMLTVFGYTPEKLAEGIALPDEAYRQNIEHQKEYGEQYQATEDLRVKSEEAHAPYITLVRLARITFAKETGAWTALGIAGERKESFSGLLAQLKQFYSNLQGNAGWLAKMAVYSVTAEKQAAGKALVKEVEEALNQQKPKWTKHGKLPGCATKLLIRYRSGTPILSPSPVSLWKTNHSTWKCWG
jgi:hypothetical protein